MLIDFCSTSDAENVINKSCDFKLVLDVKLRSDFDIDNPVLILTIPNGTNIEELNYIMIPELNRNYIVDSYERIKSNLVKFECKLDLVETYKSEILNSVGEFYRPIKAGDYQNGLIPEKVKNSIEVFSSDSTFNAGVTQIMVTVGGDKQ